MYLTTLSSVDRTVWGVFGDVAFLEEVLLEKVCHWEQSQDSVSSDCSFISQQLRPE